MSDISSVDVPKLDDNVTVKCHVIKSRYVISFVRYEDYVFVLYKINTILNTILNTVLNTN